MTKSYTIEKEKGENGDYSSFLPPHFLKTLTKSPKHYKRVIIIFLREEKKFLKKELFITFILYNLPKL